MEAVVDVEMGQHVAVGGERPLTLALLETQPAVTQPAGQLRALHRPRARRDQRVIRLLWHVKVVALEPTSGYAGPRRERLQLIRGGVADQV